MPKVVTQLHVIVGRLPEELSHCRAFYMIRTAPGKVEFEDLDAVLECGVLSEGPSLRVLEQTIASVYMPMLLQMTGADVSSAGVLLSSGTNNSHKELLGNMQKFLSQVSHALQQLNGDVTLSLPEVVIDSPEKAATDSDLVTHLEQYMAEWAQVLASVMQRESEKQPSGTGPLAEIDFWRERNAVLSALHEQLNLPHVLKMIETLELGSDDRNLLAGFKSQVGDCSNCHCCCYCCRVR